MSDIVLVVIIFIVAIVIVAVIKTMRYVLRRTLRTLLGTSSLRQGFEQQADLLARTPKSVSSMTKIYLPTITKDFPQFNWLDVKQQSDRILLSSFNAITGHDVNLVNDASDVILSQVSQMIQDGDARGTRVFYQCPKIHCTEIAGYVKMHGTCAVIIQSAVEYICYKKQGEEIIEGVDMSLTQTKYNVEMTYVQNAEIAANYGGDAAFSGIKCPSCGAAVTSIGNKICQYCGCGVNEVNSHAWTFTKFYEIPNNIV